jgi:hypothetical protein
MRGQMLDALSNVKAALLRSNLSGIFTRPATDTERYLFYLALTAIIVTTCVWLGTRGPITFPLDDAYITMHNAQVVLSGEDRNFSGVPALVGATSIIHLAFVTGLMLVLPPEPASFTVNAFAVLFYALGLARLAFCLGATPAVAALAVWVGTLSGYGLFHLFNGLETGLAMAAGVWALVFALSPAPTWQLPLLCGLMPFVRPELAALSALLMIRQTWVHWAQTGTDKVRTFTAVVRDGVLAILAAAPWLMWSWFDTGHLLPATISAKGAYFALAGLPWWRKLRFMASAVNVMTLVPAFLGLVFLRRSPITLVVWGFFGVFMAAYYAQLPAGLHHNYFRYLHILAPLSVFGLLMAACNGNRVSGYIPLAVASLLTAATLPFSWGMYETELAYTRRESAGMADWVNENLSPNARILIHDAGYIAFATPFQLIDLVGLKTPSSIPYHQRWTAPTNGAGRGEAIHQVALSSNPTHAVILNDADGYWGAAANALRQRGWLLEAIRPAPQVRGYAVFRLTAPTP